MRQGLDSLADKLLRSLHLSVEERRQLPGEAMPMSLLVRAVAAGIRKNGWFPFPVEAGSTIGEGVVIELSGGEYFVHLQHEIGIGRYSKIERRRVDGLKEAVSRYVQSIGGASIDGIRIDFEA